MKKVLGAALVLVLVASPALAGFKLMPNGTQQLVGKLGLKVTPPNDWNRLGSKIGRKRRKLDARRHVAQRADLLRRH